MTAELAIRADPLDKLSAARELLAGCRDLAQVREIRDMAVALQEYAKARRLGQDAVQFAQEIVNRAERRIGEIVAATPKVQGQRTDRLSTRPEPSPRQQLGKKLSSVAQQLAAIPPEIFDQHASKPRAALLKAARLAEAEQRRAGPVTPVTVLAGVDIRHCAITDLDLVPGSVDLIVTDPPYRDGDEGLWSALGETGARLLRPGGFLAAYSGTLQQHEMQRRVGEHLPWFWTLCVTHNGAEGQFRSRHVFCGWKPVLLFRQPGDGEVPWFRDLISDGKREKDTGHPWQQALAEARYLVATFSKPGDLVVDPFLGSGTTARACKELGRRFTGCDTDADAVVMARERVA